MTEDRENKEIRSEQAVEETVDSMDKPETEGLSVEESSNREQGPQVDQLVAELKRVKHRIRYGKVLRSTVYALVTVAAVAILVATLWMPILQITGSSMAPALEADDIVVSLKSGKVDKGDLVAFYYGNKLLVKRVIAEPSDWVDIDEEGNVYINGILLDEPYVSEKSLGDCNIELPYQVPQERYFVMGDHRMVSTDSRNTAVGCVGSEQIVGRVVFRVWPFDRFGEVGVEAAGESE